MVRRLDKQQLTWIQTGHIRVDPVYVDGSLDVIGSFDFSIKTFYVVQT